MDYRKQFVYHKELGLDSLSTIGAFPSELGPRYKGHGM